MVLDGAGWHSSKKLIAPPNMRLLQPPPYASELNPVEHIWDELREKCFHNKVFASIDALEDDLVWEWAFSLWKTRHPQFNPFQISPELLMIYEVEIA